MGAEASSKDPDAVLLKAIHAGGEGERQTDAAWGTGPGTGALVNLDEAWSPSEALGPSHRHPVHTIRHHD